MRSNALPVVDSTLMTTARMKMVETNMEYQLVVLFYETVAIIVNILFLVEKMRTELEETMR